MTIKYFVTTGGRCKRARGWKIHFANDGLQAVAASHWSRRSYPDILLTLCEPPKLHHDPQEPRGALAAFAGLYPFLQGVILLALQTT